MIKQQQAAFTSIRATLAHRNSDGAILTLIIIYKHQRWHHPEEKGPIGRDTVSSGQETDSNILSLTQKLRVLPAALWVLSRVSAFLPQVLSKGSIPACPSDCRSWLQHPQIQTEGG